MPADTLDLVTLAEAKAQLNESGTGHDDEIYLLIHAVTTAVERYVGPVVNRTITAEKHSGGTPVLFLRYWPVASVSSAAEYSGLTATALTESTNLANPAAGWQIASGSMLKRLSAGYAANFASGVNNVEVTYVAGRAAATANVPAHLKLACNEWVRDIFQTTQQGARPDWGDPDSGGVVAPLLGRVPPFVRQLLESDPYYRVGAIA